MPGVALRLVCALDEQDTEETWKFFWQFLLACAGVLGLSRFASLADAMDRQGSVPAASVASRDSPTPSRAASCGQFEVMGKGSVINDE